MHPLQSYVVSAMFSNRYRTDWFVVSQLFQEVESTMPLLKFPPDMFTLSPGEEAMYGDYSDLRAGVDYLKSLMAEGEWETRRHKAAKRFYQSLVGELEDPSGDGRYYESSDLIAWYLFLGEALTNHPQNYEVHSGSRVVPILAAIGRNIQLVSEIEGFEEKARHLLGAGRGQPNGPLFEMLVAIAYRRDGARVSFKPEKRGVAKTHDLDVEVHGRSWAVECKRLESGDYAESERARMRELWSPASRMIVPTGRSVYLKVDFKLEMQDVPLNYLVDIVTKYLRMSERSFLWDDSFGQGVIGELDLEPLQEALKQGYIMYPGPVYSKLLTGSYQRYDSMNVVHKVKFAENPHYIDEIGQAIVARWSSHSSQAIEKKARDIKRKLFAANKQLPDDKPGVIHIGIEALGADEIEARRYEKIMETINDFDPMGKPLSYVYWHYFAPEASPEETWAIDETFQWRGIGSLTRPLKVTSLILPSDSVGRVGMHWDGTPNFNNKS